MSPFIPLMILAPGLSALDGAAFHARTPRPAEAKGADCPDDLAAEMRAHLWKRRRAPRPARDAPMVRVDYHNDYGPARALLIAVDGVAVFLRCDLPEGSGQAFLGRLEPGVHHINFGFGKVGRSPYAFRVRAGKEVSRTVLLDRDDHEHPHVHFNRP